DRAGLRPVDARLDTRQRAAGADEQPLSRAVGAGRTAVAAAQAEAEPLPLTVVLGAARLPRTDGDDHPRRQPSGVPAVLQPLPSVLLPLPRRPGRPARRV